MPDLDPQTFVLPAPLAELVREQLGAWDATEGTRRLWAGDASLWTGRDEASWLGWLGIVAEQRRALPALLDLRAEVAREGIAHVLLLGMGGSSLCPEVFALTFGRVAGHPELRVLDSTDPAQVAATFEGVDLASTLVIVSSKSGSTLEPNIFKAIALERVRAKVGSSRAGRQFVAVTDPGSKLEAEARAEGFRAVFPGVKSIGGRYSALSNFGLVPAAVMGLDVGRLLDEAAVMVAACSPGGDAATNPGVSLGVTLGTLARHGRDKLTLAASPGIHDLGAWLEQLIAESTGKEGKAIIPVDREALGDPARYGNDRVFAHLILDGEADPAQEGAIAALERAGHPVVRITLGSREALAQEFFRWEIATATAGALLGIHPFDQPDVEASKLATRALTSQIEATGALPAETPCFIGSGVALFADAANLAALERGGRPHALSGWLAAHLARLEPGDYMALLAYLPMNAGNEALLERVRLRVRDARRVATSLGFGPRFLHSTGQAYKGGPNSGVFLQVTCDDAHDLAVPGQRYSFGLVKAAQARGDLQVLSERGRRALRVHLGPDVARGLAALDDAIRDALA